MRFAFIFVLFSAAAAPAVAGETTLATGVVKKVEMGYQWVGWVKNAYGVYEYAGVVPQLRATLADGSQWGSCYNGPADPGKSCVATNAGTPGQMAKCSLVEYSAISYNSGADTGNQLSIPYNSHPMPYGAGHQVTRKLNPLLAMLSMAGLKALPVQLKDLGGHPDFVQAKCFDSVVVCFGGTCN